MPGSRLLSRISFGLVMIGLSCGYTVPPAIATTASPPAQEMSSKNSPVVKPADNSRKRARARKAATAMTGTASVYSDALNGRKTSSGQRFSQEKLTAAHRTLPLGTRVLVTNLQNNRSVEVSINDRGPHHRGRVIDLSSAAAQKLGMNTKGCAQVKLQILRSRSNG